MHACPVARRQSVTACSTVNKRLKGISVNQSLYRSFAFRASVPRVQKARKPDRRACMIQTKSAPGNGAQLAPAKRAAVSDKEGPSTDFKVIWSRLWKVKC